MANISVSLPSDGETIDVADYNTPITTIVNEFNGNLDNSNIATAAAIAGSKLADGAITNAKLSTSSGEIGGAWASWTPTWSNLTVGDGTVIAKYVQVGKTVNLRLLFRFGSTSSISGSVTFTPPVTGIAYGNTGSGNPNPGIVHIEDNATQGFFGTISYTPTVFTPLVLGASGTYVTFSALSSTVPMTWVAGDEMIVTLTYEAA